MDKSIVDGQSLSGLPGRRSTNPFYGVHIPANEFIVKKKRYVLHEA
jgi:hypothetical protein